MTADRSMPVRALLPDRTPSAAPNGFAYQLRGARAASSRPGAYAASSRPRRASATGGAVAASARAVRPAAQPAA